MHWTWFLDQFILGEFKWTILGAVLALSGLGVGRLLAYILAKITKAPRWLAGLMAFILGAACIGLAVWYGHELIDPWLHAAADWWVTPLGEPLDLHH